MVIGFTNSKILVCPSEIRIKTLKELSKMKMKLKISKKSITKINSSNHCHRV